MVSDTRICKPTPTLYIVYLLQCVIYIGSFFSICNCPLIVLCWVLRVLFMTLLLIRVIWPDETPFWLAMYITVLNSEYFRYSDSGNSAFYV
jgi:hypothetical protein